MFKLFRFLKPYLVQVILLLITIATQAWATLELPAKMADIINNGIVAGDMNYIWQTGLQMIGLTLLASVCAFLSGFLSAKIGTGFSRDIRNAFFRQVLSFSVSEIDDFSTASLITRTTNDIQIVQQTVVMLLSMAIRAPMMCIIALTQAIRMAPSMTWIIAVAVGTIVLLSLTILGIVMPKFNLLRQLADRITLLTRENLTGLRVIRAFNNETIEEKKFAKTNHENAKWSIWVDTIMSLTNPLISMVMNGVTLLCVWVGISLMTKDFSYLGNMTAFMQYAIQVVMSFLILTMLFVMIPRASVSAKRINKVLDAKPKIVWQAETTKKPDLKASVEFRKVDFCYPGADEKVLQNVSFRAEAGQTTAFIGSTGSGKSTLINLVPRFYEATSGEILINGIKLQDYAEKDLMRRIGYVPQRGKLFAGTIRSNILFGVEDLDRKEAGTRMKEAAKVAQADEFIKKLENGYEAHISQGGTNVSGGQKQRLSIARAIAKKPDIYIFDDAFSALDMKTDRELRAALEPITKDAVTLIVAQRISTIKNADQIIVLDQGKVVGTGKHSELLHDCRVYREIAKSQLSSQEFEEEIKNA